MTMRRSVRTLRSADDWSPRGEEPPKGWRGAGRRRGGRNDRKKEETSGKGEKRKRKQGGERGELEETLNRMPRSVDNAKNFKNALGKLKFRQSSHKKHFSKRSSTLASELASFSRKVSSSPLPFHRFSLARSVVKHYLPQIPRVW